jgi:hypothetical protein
MKLHGAVFGLFVILAGCQSIPSGPSVMAYDQNYRYANAINISRVSSDSPGWVAVYASENGIPGNIIGATRVPAGVSYSVRVDVDASRGSRILVVKLLTDDAGKPGSPVMANGKEVMTSFIWARTYRRHM